MYPIAIKPTNLKSTVSFESSHFSNPVNGLNESTKPTSYAKEVCLLVSWRGRESGFCYGEEIGEYVELDSEGAKEEEDESSNNDESQDRGEHNQRDIEYASFENHRPHREENDERYAQQDQHHINVIALWLDVNVRVEHKRAFQ